MEVTASAEVDPTAMEVAAEEGVRTSASATAHGGQAPTGEGPPLPLRASLPGDGQHGPHDATRSNARTQPTPSPTQSLQRRESQPVEAHRTPAKEGGNATTTSVGPSHHADRASHTNSPPHSYFPPYHQQTADPQEPPNDLLAAAVRPSSVCINMRSNRFPIHSLPSHLLPFQYNSLSAFPRFKPTIYSCPGTSCAVGHRCHERRLCGSPRSIQCRPFSG